MKYLMKKHIHIHIDMKTWSNNIWSNTYSTQKYKNPEIQEPRKWKNKHFCLYMLQLWQLSIEDIFIKINVTWICTCCKFFNYFAQISFSLVSTCHNLNNIQEPQMQYFFNHVKPLGQNNNIKDSIYNIYVYVFQLQ